MKHTGSTWSRCPACWRDVGITLVLIVLLIAAVADLVVDLMAKAIL